MGNFIESLNNSISQWVKDHPLRSPFSPDNQQVASDAIKIITLESGGNPYAVNDNTTGKSYQFSNYGEASQYVNSHAGDTMAIGLFQLLTHAGMGAAYSDNPSALLDPELQLKIAIPQIIQNDTGPNMPLDAEGQFNKMLGNAWYADRGLMGKLTTDNIQATLTRLNDPSASSDAGKINGTTLPLGEAIGATNPFKGLQFSDIFGSLWNMNTLYVLGGSLGVLLILVNMAKGGRD